MGKLDDFVRRRTNIVKQLHNQAVLYRQFDAAATFYKKKETQPKSRAKKEETNYGSNEDKQPVSS